MKICLLSYRGNMYCGGQGIYLWYLSRELARLGHEVHVLVGPPWPDPMEWAQVHRIENPNFWGCKRWGRERVLSSFANPFRVFFPLNFYELVVTRLGFFPESFAFSIRAFLKLKELLRAQSFDIIHDIQSLGYGLLLMKAFEIPIIATIHHPLSVDRRTHLAHDRTFWEKFTTLAFFPVVMQKLVANRLDMVITASRSGLEELKDSFGLLPEKVRLVLNGLDTDAFRPRASGLKKRGMLLFVGNADNHRKGVSYLLKALMLLPPEVKLTIVDKGKATTPRLVEEFGLEDRVTFTGNLTTERLVDEYSRAEITVVPSLYEGFGLPAAESMACETPVVATTAGALRQVIGNRQTGLLVPPRNPQSLARAIETLLGDRALREQMGRAGRKRVERYFTWREAARKTVEVYEEVLA